VVVAADVAADADKGEGFMNSLTRYGIGVAIGATLFFAGCSKTEESGAAPDSHGDSAAASSHDAEPVPAKPAQSFDTPDNAFTALVTAVRASDRDSLGSILGVDFDEFVPTEPVDRADVEKFLAAYDASHKIVNETPQKAVLAVGDKDWEFPIPLVESGGKWTFDLEQGRETIAVRRIGRNELAVMQTALAYCDAQQEYAEKDRNGDGLAEYAQKFISTEGQKDGLYWPGEGADQSPLGPALDETVQAGEPYHGYHYRILTSQGPHAKSGTRTYMLGKRMSGGFAMIAWPAAYGDTGIMTFIVNHEGKIYQKDLGDDTEAAAAVITSFDPDNTWTEAKPEPIS